MKSDEQQNPWFDEEVELLRSLVAENIGNVEISKRLGRSVLSIKSKVSRLGMPARVRPQKSWPPEEVAKLLMLKDEMKLGWTEIAKRLGRSSGTCWSKYDYLKRAPIKNRVVTEREPVNAEAHREWLRRQSLNPATLTAAIFGDPLPGYSALDKRHA